MTFNTIDSISKSFCKNKELTSEMVGNLQNHKIRVIASGNFIGRILHMVRYYFSKEYHQQFDLAAREYIDAHTKLKNRDVIVRPKEDSLQVLVPVQNKPAEEMQKSFEQFIPPTPEARQNNGQSVPKQPNPTMESRPGKIVETAQVNPVKPLVDPSPVFAEIQSKLGPNAANLWRTLFNRFATSTEYGSNWLSGISKKSDGSFQLHFPTPLKLYLRSTDIDKKGNEVEDPPGGVVMIFGANHAPLTIKIENGIMSFEGLTTFSKAPFGMGRIVGDPVDADLISFKSHGDTEFTITGYKKLLIGGKSKATTKSYEKILENWGRQARILPPNTSPESVILKK